MYKKIFLIMISTLMIFSLCSCKKDKIIVSNEFTFEESFEKLEKDIADKYELENFELVRIELETPKGAVKTELRIHGYYQNNGKTDVWFHRFNLTENDKETLYSLNDIYGTIIYNEKECYYLSQPDEQKILPIRTDVPGWVIEGIYNIVF